MAELVQQLQCLGHYGYGSGWTDSDFCDTGCSYRNRCLATACGEVMGRGRCLSSTNLGAFKQQEILLGKGDRNENSSRYATEPEKVPKFTEKAKPPDRVFGLPERDHSLLDVRRAIHDTEPADS